MLVRSRSLSSRPPHPMPFTCCRSRPPLGWLAFSCGSACVLVTPLSSWLLRMEASSGSLVRFRQKCLVSRGRPVLPVHRLAGSRVRLLLFVVSSGDPGAQVVTAPPFCVRSGLRVTCSHPLLPAAWLGSCLRVSFTSWGLSYLERQGGCLILSFNCQFSTKVEGWCPSDFLFARCLASLCPCACPLPASAHPQPW